MVKRLMMFLAVVLLSGAAMAQSQVSGTVVDEDGEPVIGASVIVTGTKTGSITDVDGNFSFSAPANSTLTVSYVGMDTRTVKAGQNLKITLKSSSENLDEVMVVAYGTQKRSSFTGSAADVKSEDISKHVVSTATSALTGSVAGLQTITSSGEPGSAPTIRIRGIGSYAASSNPLYIVDGAPYDGSIASINPTDIQEITVLKDAASAAIYGARGANGVVIITTKKSRGAQDAKVTFDAKWGSNHREIPRYDVITDPAQYYETWFKAMYNSQYLHGSTAEQAYQWANNNLYNVQNGGLGYQVYTIPEGQYLIGTDFKLNPNATLGYSDGEYYYQPDDYYDKINQSAFRQEYNLGISGSGDKFSYYTNVGFLSDGGSVEHSSFKRYTARTNVEYQAKKWLKFATNLDYSHIDSESPSYDDSTYGSSANMFDIATTIAPIYPMYVRNADGSLKLNASGGPIFDVSSNTNQHRAAVTGNAMGNNYYDRTNIGIDQFRGNWVATVTPIDGLNIAANFTAFNRTTNSNYLYSKFASTSADEGGTYVGSSRIFSTNQIYTVNYDKQFGKHAINLLGGYEHYFRKASNVGGSNYRLFDPFIAELGNAYGRSKMSTSSYTDKLVRDGWFFRGDYNYDERYFGEFSLRRDGSSIFAPGHRWGTFWSISGGWMLSKEKWFKADWVDLLKLKISYGEQGNDNLASSDYPYHPWSDFYTPSYDEDNNIWSQQLTYKGNSELTWEKSGEWNFGVDFAMFKNRLSGTVEYFHKKTHDLLYWKSLPLSSGESVASYPANIGALVNKGIEVTIQGDIIRTKHLTWSANANLTSVKTKFTELDPSIAEEGLKSGSRIIRVGGSFYEAYMYKYAGVDQENGHPLFYMDETDENGNVTGQTTTDDITKATKYDLGDVMPDIYGGFGMSVNWKPSNAGELDFSFQFSYQLGGRVYDGLYQRYMTIVGNGGQAFHKDVLKAWDPTTNPNGTYPVLSTVAADGGNVGQNSVDRFLTKSNYLNLNNVTLGYSFPKQWIKKLMLSNLRIYVAGENLFIATARKGLDPRVTMGIGGYTSGAALIGGGGYSAMRSITGGIQLTF